MKGFEEQIIEFEKNVKEVFEFLELEYNYVRSDLYRQKFNSRDANVSVLYLGKAVGVKVIWRLVESAISVALYELEEGTMPEKSSFYGGDKYSRAISLNTLVKMLSDDKIKPPLPEITPNISIAEMCRRAEKATEMIRTDIGGILKTFAERLKKYASDILKGDTSIFPKVQEQHRKHWEV